MTTGRPRLESSPAGQRAIVAVLAILYELRQATISEIAYELRKRGIERPTGGLDWNDRAVKRLVERIEAMDERDRALNAKMIDSKEVVSAMAKSMARDVDQKILERYRAEIETLDATPKRPDGIGKDEWL